MPLDTPQPLLTVSLRYARAVAFADSMVVRLCECGRPDLRERWPSAAAAERDGVWQRLWSCEACGGSSFALVVPAPRVADDGVPIESDVEGWQHDPNVPHEVLREAEGELEQRWRAELAGRGIARVMALVREIVGRRRRQPDDDRRVQDTG